MNWPPRQILVTGAAGYIGSRLAARLIADPALGDTRITLCDPAIMHAAADARVEIVEGDLTEETVQEKVLADEPDIVFHLAGILGGAAERDPVMARRVNVEATLTLFDRLANPDAPPRLVFASSIAVFGPPLPAEIDDDTPAYPTMLYGAHKLMMETALTQMSARGLLDGIALRLPGIVARPGADARQKSAFLNAVFERHATGGDIELPVSPSGTTWLISVEACVDALLHAARLDPALLGQRRAMTLPAQNIRIGDLVTALREAFPDGRTAVTYRPNSDIEAQFASQPPQRAQLAEELGFRHDGSIGELVRRAMLEFGG